MIKVRQAIRLMPVDDEIFFSIRRRMDHLSCNRDVTKPHPHKLLDEFVMITGNINHLGLLAAFAEQFLDQHIVVITPIPAKFQFPAINKIANEIKVFAIHDAQKVQQLLHPRVFGAEVDVGDPHRTADDRFIQIQVKMGLVIVHRTSTTRLCSGTPAGSNDNAQA